MEIHYSPLGRHYNSDGGVSPSKNAGKNISLPSALRSPPKALFPEGRRPRRPCLKKVVDREVNPPMSLFRATL